MTQAEDVRVWNAARVDLYCETHVFYVNAKYKGSVYRQFDRWTATLSKSDDFPEIADLEAGKKYVEENTP